MTYVSPLPGPPKRSPLPVLFGVLAFVILVGLGVVVSLASRTKQSAKTGTATQATVSEIFNQAVLQGLSTSSYERRTVYYGLDLTMDFDVSAPVNMRYSGTALSTTAKGSASLELYGNLTNTFMRYTDGTSPNLAPAAALNQWLWVRQQGVVPALAAGSDRLSQLNSPESAILGAYVMAKLSDEQKAAAATYLQTHEVYKFDATKVTKATVDGKEYYVYLVDFNTDNLLAYNKLIAADFGLTDANSADAFANLRSYSANTVYVDPEAKRIVKVEYTPSGGSKVIRVYSKFDSAATTSQPAQGIIITKLSPAPAL